VGRTLAESVVSSRLLFGADGPKNVNSIPNCRIVIQARMTSSRFPGKVLAPLHGRPLLAHVVERARLVPEADDVIVATSTAPSDEPVALYAEHVLRAPVFRGDLENVALRFQQCIREWPCRWFVRVSGDSPVIDPELVSALVARAHAGTDLVTNVAVRTFPPGQSVEVIRSEVFLSLDTGAMTPEEQEHVTTHYYRNPNKFHITNVESGDVRLAERRLVVDTVDDLNALERLLTGSPELVTGYGRRLDAANS
jgi:spore coat polysaccharide biosynthesis protein SpsF